MGLKFKQETSEINFISSGLSLLRYNVPFLGIWHFRGEIRHTGSKCTTEWYKNLDERTKADLNIALINDMNNNDSDEPLMVNPENLSDREKAVKISKSYDLSDAHPSGLPLLPFPASLMSKRQALKYLSEQISREEKAKHPKKLTVKVKYGLEETRPSFWLEELWSWTNVTLSLYTVTDSKYTGMGTWVEFIKKSLEALLILNNVDPETHVVDLSNRVATVTKKRRHRGIFLPPMIIQSEGDVLGDNCDQVQEVSDHAEEGVLSHDQEVTECAEDGIPVQDDLDQELTDYTSLGLVREESNDCIAFNIEIDPNHNLNANPTSENAPLITGAETNQTGLGYVAREHLPPPVSTSAEFSNSLPGIFGGSFAASSSTSVKISSTGFSGGSFPSSTTADISSTCFLSGSSFTSTGVGISSTGVLNGSLPSFSSTGVGISSSDFSTESLPASTSAAVGSLSSSASSGGGISSAVFTPRRTIGKSPLKCATESNPKKRKVKLKGLEDVKKKRPEPQFSALPRAVKNKFENSQIQKNSGGGAACIKQPCSM